MKYTYNDLVELLTRAHAKLEAVTDAHGCPFSTAVVLVDCETALKAIKGEAKPAKKATAKGLALVH